MQRFQRIWPGQGQGVHRTRIGRTFGLSVSVVLLSTPLLSRSFSPTGSLTNGRSGMALQPALSQATLPVWSPKISVIKACASDQPVSPPSEMLQQQATALLSWVQSPERHLEPWVQSVGARVAAQLTPVPWPDIHEQARLARVPVLMYHDVLETPEVFFDLTPEQLRMHFDTIQAHDLTPISLDQLVVHLRTGAPLPQKPVLLTFDDGYAGHYTWVYPLLQEYGYPAVFSVFPGKLDGEIVGRSTLTWEQLRTMAADPLVTIAAHSVTHPPDLRQLSDEALRREVWDSRQRLEAQLGMPIRYFTYPAGWYDERVAAMVAEAGYTAALTMDDDDEQFAGESESLLAIARFGQSRLDQILPATWGGPPLPTWGSQFNFTAPIEAQQTMIEGVALSLIAGGRPHKIHADSRYQVVDIIAGTRAAAAVDGGFFSLKYLDSNVMIGPVLSQNTGEFIPGQGGEVPLLQGRPLVLISPEQVKFIPFEPDRHNTLVGLQAELPGLTDAFVAAAWLVKDGLPQPASTFGSLFDYDASRHRAFWGIDQTGRPMIGVSNDRVDAVRLGDLLQQVGYREAVMLDSGASTSLVHGSTSLVAYEPRPVPHVVALFPATAAMSVDVCMKDRSMGRQGPGM